MFELSDNNQIVAASDDQIRLPSIKYCHISPKVLQEVHAYRSKSKEEWSISRLVSGVITPSHLTNFL